MCSTETLYIEHVVSKLYAWNMDYNLVIFTSCFQAPKLIRQLSSDQRLDAGIKSEAAQVSKKVFTFRLKYILVNLRLVKQNANFKMV